MKAWTLYDIGDLRYQEVEVPSPGEGEVRIQVKAAGICGSDIPRIYVEGAHKMPLIPGHEFSGVVEGIGKGVDPRWLEKRVGIYPLIPCGKCVSCRAGHPETCRDYDYVGSRRNGAFAEYVTAPAANLIELPEQVSFEEAAMLEPMAVAAHAVKLGVEGLPANAPSETKAVVCGLGPIGLLVVMFLKERGYQNVFVIGNKDGQQERAATFGVGEQYFCDSRTEGVVAWLKENARDYDLFFECVGRSECFAYGLEGSGPMTKIVLVGNPHGDVSLPKDVYWKILRNQLRVAGAWNSTFHTTAPHFYVPPEEGETDKRCGWQCEMDDWQYVMERLARGSISPKKLITHKFPLRELDVGLHIMRDKTEDACKVMVVL